MFIQTFQLLTSVANTHWFNVRDAMTHNPKLDWHCPFLRGLFVRPDVVDHSLLKHLLHGLFYLLEEDLRDPTAQGVDRVQELGLDGVEEGLEHVVLKGKLQGQRHSPVSVLIPKPFQSDAFLMEHITA